MLRGMLLIAAALAEEMDAALNLCSRKKKVRASGVSMWACAYGRTTVHMLKLGTGPARSAAVLERALAVFPISEILVIGYAGALDPGLKLGDLVVVERAHLLAENHPDGSLADVGLERAWRLAHAPELVSLLQSAGISGRSGTALTAPCIIGAPEEKAVLFRKFGATVVDMETASIARIAAQRGVITSCFRAISDEAQDRFLETFTYAPDGSRIRQGAKFLAAGGWIRRYSQWRERSQAAQASLRQFLPLVLNAYSNRT